MNQEKIKRVQNILKKEQIEGWLLYDFQKRNFLAMEFLEIPSTQFLSRRLFYWIPAEGVPVKISHATESHVLDHVPGKQIVYFQRQTLEEEMKALLKGKSRIAMEYSPRNAIPYVSFVDGGTLEWIREMGPEVVSSASFVQEFTCTLSPQQRKGHLEAARILEEAVEEAWSFLADRLRKGEKVTEYDAQQLILSRLEKEGCLCEGGPICAVNENSSNPHYVPTLEKHRKVQKGDFILIDLWAKKKETGSIYADICRVGVAASMPTQEQEQVFAIVKKAQESATNLVIQRFSEKRALHGWEVDLAARKVIEDAGYGKYFVHRTGHNIYMQDHGPGTHMDSIETYDDRLVLPGTCFSIEPGIYLPEKFGVRLEYDVFVTQEGIVEISGGVQEKVRCLL